MLKKTFKIFSIIAVLSFFISATLFSGQPTTLNHPQAIRAAQSLPRSGILKQDRNGYLYLDISDQYIDQAWPHVKWLDRGITKNRSPYGAHITVHHPAQNGKKIKITQELGQRIFFTVQSLQEVTNGADRYYFYRVKSPYLSKIRTKYGLSPLPNGHDFHITVAKSKLTNRNKPLKTTGQPHVSMARPISKNYQQKRVATNWGISRKNYGRTYSSQSVTMSSHSSYRTNKVTLNLKNKKTKQREKKKRSLILQIPVR